MPSSLLVMSTKTKRTQRLLTLLRYIGASNTFLQTLFSGFFSAVCVQVTSFKLILVHDDQQK